MERRPSRLLAALRACGALAQVLPEVDALYGVPQSVAAHPEIDTGVHAAQALDYAATKSFELAVRYAVLAPNLGKRDTPPDGGATHRGQEARSVKSAERMSARLKVPVECRDAARLAARWISAVHRATELPPAALLDLLIAADALRRPERLDLLLAASEADMLSRPGAGTTYAPAQIIREAHGVVRGVPIAAIAREAERNRSGGGDAIATSIRAARLAALRAWRRQRAKPQAN